MNRQYVKNIIVIFIILGFYLLSLLVALNFIDIKVTLILYVVSLLIVVIYCLNYLRFLSTSFIFILFYIMLFYIQPILYLLFDIPFGYPVNVVKTYSMMATAGLTLFLIGNILLFKKQNRISYLIEIKLGNLKKTILVLSVFTIVMVLFLFIDIGSLNILAESRRSLKEGDTILRSIASTGMHFISLLVFLVAFSKNARRSSKNNMWIIAFVLFEILVFMFFRTRTLIVEHTIALAVGYYFCNYFRTDKEHDKQHQSSLNLFKNIKVVSSLIILFILAISLRFFRGYLEPGSKIENFNFNVKLFIELSIENGDIGYSQTIMQLLEYVPNITNYLDGQSYYRILFIFIPRFVWEDKPLNTQRVVAGWLTPESDGQTTPPGIFGDLYINFGYMGIIGMLAYGFIFHLFDQKVKKFRYFIWAFSGAWIFHLVRGGFTNPILTFLMLLVSLIIINRFLLKVEIIGKPQNANKLLN